MIQTVNGKYPKIHKGAYIHPTAVVIGDVELNEEASVWPGAVLRGDIKSIIIGKGTNIQDGSVLHTSDFKVEIGEMVTVGHNALLHSCEIGKGTLIGTGAIILDAVKIGENCIIAAGTLIPGGKVIPDGSVVMGNPYKIVRKTTQQDLDHTRQLCNNYTERLKMYKRTGDIL